MAIQNQDVESESKSLDPGLTPEQKMMKIVQKEEIGPVEFGSFTYRMEFRSNEHSYDVVEYGEAEINIEATQDTPQHELLEQLSEGETLEEAADKAYRSANPVDDVEYLGDLREEMDSNILSEDEQYELQDLMDRFQIHTSEDNDEKRGSWK